MTNGGPVSNGVKVAGSIVDNLKTQPLLLALLVLNGGFFALLHFTAADNRERQAVMVQHLLDNQSKLQEALTRCTFAPRSEIQVPTPG